LKLFLRIVQIFDLAVAAAVVFVYAAVVAVVFAAVVAVVFAAVAIMS
jgi:hypothetical protein